MHKAENTDVIIIGAGIIGICSALSILETGKSVRLIDRGEPGQATSFGNAGVISPWSVVPQSMPGLWKQIPSMLFGSNGPIAIRPCYLPSFLPWALKFLRQGTEARANKTADSMQALNHANVELFRQHLAGTGHESLIEDSHYIHAFRNAKDGSLTDLCYRIRRARGAEIELIKGGEIQSIEPILSTSFQSAILIRGQARARSPSRIGTVLAEKAARLGVILTKAEVQKLQQTDGNGWMVITDQGAYNASKVVLAAGPWSARLLSPMGINVPLEAERGYHVEFSDPKVQLYNSVMDMDMNIVASSMELGVRIAGTAEFSGLDQPANPKRVELLKKQAKMMMPDLNTTQMTSWMGARPSLPDSLPIISDLFKGKGLIGAFGHSHHGLMMAPRTGQLVADLVSDRTPNVDMMPFAADRF
jgi:D-amino-acid dehydrogenase